MKSGVFGVHPSLYAGIRDEVTAWVSTNYITWNEEHPEWFTERVKASIPKDMIPESEVELKKEEGNGARHSQRKSSVEIVAAFGVAVRDSVRG